MKILENLLYHYNELEKVFTIEYSPPNGQGSSGVVNLRDFINEIQDRESQVLTSRRYESSSLQIGCKDRCQFVSNHGSFVALTLPK
jgi:hypothetical protein